MNAHILYIILYRAQNVFCDSLISMLLFHKQGTYIGAQIFTVVKVIFDDSCSTNNLPVITHDNIPLGYAAFLRDTFMHAVEIHFKGNTPLV